MGVSATGQRRSKRSRVLLAAKLRTPSGEIEVRLRDVSPRGALLECAQMPPAGTDVVFVRGSISVPAKVAWSGAGRVGLEFAFPVDQKKLMVQLRKVAAEEPRGRWSPASLDPNMSTEAMKLARAWGVTVGINLPESDK